MKQYKLYKVSICVPVYGVEKYIERCARSLFEQTYKNIEYIFVNDCTKDNSITILERVLEEYPNRKSQVHIITHEKNRGLGAARNTAVNSATGDFLFHVDSDDYIDNTTIEKCVRKQIETEADIVTCNVYYDYDNKRVKYNHFTGKSSEEWKVLLFSRTAKIMIWGRLIRTSLYKEYHIHVREGYNMGEDFQVTPKLGYYANKIELVNENLYFYNKENDTSYSANFSETKAIQTLKSVEFLFDFLRGKETKYTEALKYSEAQILAEVTIWCCRFGDKNFFEKELKQKIKMIDRKYYRKLSKSYQIPFIIPIPSLLILYAQVGHKLKNWKKDIIYDYK